MSDGQSQPSRDDRIGQNENYAGTHYPPQAYAPPAQHYPHGYAYAPPARRPVSGGLVTVAWIIAVCTLLYMLPWAIAVTRNRSNMAAIGLLNFLLGWSFIGWVVSLVMACGSEPQVTVVQQPTYPPTGYPPPHG